MPRSGSLWEPLRGPGTGSSDGENWCRDGFNHASCVGDLDLAGLGLFGDGDGEGEHTVLVVGGDLLAVQALSEEQPTAELALGPLGDLDLIALGADPSACRSHREDIPIPQQTRAPPRGANSPGSTPTAPRTLGRISAGAMWRHRHRLSGRKQSSVGPARNRSRRRSPRRRVPWARRRSVASVRLDSQQRSRQQRCAGRGHPLRCGR